MSTLLFFFNDTATTEIYTLSLPDALPISQVRRGEGDLFPPDAVREWRRVHAQLSGNHGRRAARYRAADHDHVPGDHRAGRSEDHTSELQPQSNIVCRLLLEKTKTIRLRLR